MKPRTLYRKYKQTWRDIKETGRVRELLKTVCKRISLHFPQIWGMHSLFRN
jgi:hypothetical protein